MQKSVGFIVLLLFLCLLLCTVSVSYSVMALKPRMTKKRRLLEGDHSSADLCRAASYNESLSSEGNMREIKNDQTFVASIAESSFHDDSIHDQIMARTESYKNCTGCVLMEKEGYWTSATTQLDEFLKQGAQQCCQLL